MNDSQKGPIGQNIPRVNIPQGGMRVGKSNAALVTFLLGLLVASLVVYFILFPYWKSITILSCVKHNIADVNVCENIIENIYK